jgi:hypothetical protein
MGITGRLSSMPDSYTDGFAGSFGMFNLQTSPPSWAKSVMKMEWDRDDDGNSTASDGDAEGRRLGAFYDDSEATQTMRGHLFNTCFVVLFTLLLHGAGLLVARHKGWTVPGMLTFPQVEIKVALALATGVLDTSLFVLMSPESAAFWKVIAALEVALALAFIAWFLAKGLEFQRDIQWVPISNVPRRNVLHALWPPDKDKSGFLSKDEVRGFVWIVLFLCLLYSKCGQLQVLAAAKEMGQSEEEGLALFLSLDEDGNGVLDYTEFSKAFGEEGLKSKVW